MPRTRACSEGRAQLLDAGPLPTGSGWSYELNWDGFRALVSSAQALCLVPGRSFTGRSATGGSEEALQ